MISVLAIIADTPATTAENPDTERSSKMIELDQLSKTYTKGWHPGQGGGCRQPEGGRRRDLRLPRPVGMRQDHHLKMINRLINPTSGRVLLNGQDTSGIDEVELRRHIGYVIQQIGLFPT
jgi:osmoprotectant transport system ATP-binding protein